MEKVIIEKVIFSLNMFLGRDIDKKIKREIAELAASKIMEAIDKGECQSKSISREERRVL